MIGVLSGEDIKYYMMTKGEKIQYSWLEARRGRYVTMMMNDQGREEGING